jgi:hypothetical protein
MEWNDDSALTFTELNKAKPALLDQKHRKHSNKCTKYDVWEESGMDMGKTFDDCKRKRSLLSSSRAEIKLEMYACFIVILGIKVILQILKIFFK